jgi:hypothetical protein
MLRDHLDISESTRTKSRQDNQLEMAADLEVMAVLVASAMVAMVVKAARAALGVLVQVNTWPAQALAQ